MRPLAFLLLGPLALAACSPDPAAPPEDPASPSPQANQTASSAAGPTSISPTTGGDGSEIRLTPLTVADRDADPLEGELGCTFVEGRDALLVAMGNVADTSGHAQALAKIGDVRERLLARETGGFDGLPDGAAFGGRGMTFTITRTSNTPVEEGESPGYPAELLLQRADGAERVIAGVWTCGP